MKNKRLFNLLLTCLLTVALAGGTLVSQAAAQENGSEQPAPDRKGLPQCGQRGITGRRLYPG